MFHRPPNIKTKRASRRGAAVVEFAVCLPLIVLIVFGGIEAANMLFLRQTLVQAAYEGIKTGVKVDGTAVQAQASAQAVCDGRNLQNVTISLSPSNLAAVSRGDIIEITVSAPGDDNSIFPFGPFAGKDVTASAVMVKE
ncbi:TadE/TadG family type IV pilus assembly protein [Mariniblastus fucicola]|uniref:TadE-like protein n=1 Tax=Mariniblastus fucicola TaxID=980251 RepID=A0A5B9PBE1_9BACT|nr:TadE family protein [Mariniblastus fucicola]QEG21836.1 TadE-like protein [Mariniblastus fucicola]